MKKTVLTKSGAMALQKAIDSKSVTAPNDGVFDDRTPGIEVEIPIGKQRKYRLFDQHHGHFVIKNLTNNLFIHRHVDKVEKKVTYKDVELKEATTFHYYALGFVTAELLNKKEMNIDCYMRIAERRKKTGEITYKIR